MTISAFLPVFNEEKRINDTMESLLWCDEIILVDKKSTDNTVAIAMSYGDKVKVCSMNNTDAYDSSEWTVFLDNCSSEWVILFTASDVIHPKLAMEIRDKIKDLNFNFDIIKIPFRRFVLGIDSKRSPWYSELNSVVMRKRSIFINKNGVHDALKTQGKEYEFKYNDVECMYHLTHETVDVMMDRHIRYWRGEASVNTIDLKKSFKSALSGLLNLIFIRRTWMLGYDGLMLMFAYLSYLMMSYVYKWESKRGNAVHIYDQIKHQVNDQWEDFTEEKLK